MGSYLLGIDVGTTSTKAIVIDRDGHRRADASRPVTLTSRQATWAEEDPQEWWRNVVALVPELLAQAQIHPQEIAAVGACGMVPALVLLDERGAALRPSIQQNDARAAAEIDEQRRQTDPAEILSRTGSAITQQSIGPKLLWLRRHEPGVFRRAAHVLGSYDYIVFRLTGSFSAERNWALESGLYDLQNQDWDDRLLVLAGIERSWLGSLHAPAEIAGSVTTEAARETGIPAGTPVVAGCADHIASAFSAGLCNPGDLLVKLGGAGDILFCLDQAVTDPRLFLDYHVIPGKYLINGCMAASGSLIRWFRDQFAPGVDYSALDARAADLPAGSDGLILLPYFLGEKTPLNDPQARGTLVGLTLSHTQAHVYRAVLEGIAYGFRHHLAVLAEHGWTPARVRLTNGGAHSLLWRQVTADVLGLPLEPVADHPGSSLGAAFVAGMGCGIFQDWAEIDRLIAVQPATQPNLENHARYEKLFPLYREVYERLKDVYPQISQAVEPGAAPGPASPGSAAAQLPSPY
jgi:xylulokinase